MSFGVERIPVTSLCNTSVWARGAWVNAAFQAEALHRNEVWRQQLKFENFWYCKIDSFNQTLMDILKIVMRANEPKKL